MERQCAHSTYIDMQDKDTVNDGDDGDGGDDDNGDHAGTMMLFWWGAWHHHGNARQRKGRQWQVLKSHWYAALWIFNVSLTRPWAGMNRCQKKNHRMSNSRERMSNLSPNVLLALPGALYLTSGTAGDRTQSRLFYSTMVLHTAIWDVFFATFSLNVFAFASFASTDVTKKKLHPAAFPIRHSPQLCFQLLFQAFLLTTSLLRYRWSQSQLFIHWDRFLIHTHLTLSNWCPVRCGVPIVPILQMFNNSHTLSCLSHSTFRCEKLKISWGLGSPSSSPSRWPAPPSSLSRPPSASSCLRGAEWEEVKCGFGKLRHDNAEDNQQTWEERDTRGEMSSVYLQAKNIIVKHQGG